MHGLTFMQALRSSNCGNYSLYRQSLCKKTVHLLTLCVACSTGKYRQGSALSRALPLGVAYGRTL